MIILFCFSCFLSYRGIGVYRKTPEKLRNELKTYFTIITPKEQENEQNKRFVLFSLNVAKDIHDSKPFQLLSALAGNSV